MLTGRAKAYSSSGSVV